MLPIADLPAGRLFTASDVLSPYVFVFYGAYLTSFFLTPMLRNVAIYYGIIDEPDHIRKMHRMPVAYLGGLAVFLGWLVGLGVSQYFGLHFWEPGQPDHLIINFGIVAGACTIVMLGLWDDIFKLNAWTKIGGQVAAACMLLWAGVGRQCTWIFVAPVLNGLHNRFPAIPGDYAAWQGLVAFTSYLFVIVLVVGCCNATNLMDGLDGLCGGVTSVVSLGFLVLAVHLATLGGSGGLTANEDALRVVLALALLGGVLGFIPYNFNPASIFMGDTGSMFLGFACATMMLLFAGGSFPKWFLASVVIFALPVLDTILAFVRRWVNGRPIFSADRYHFHHQLVARGFSVKQTVVISYGLAIVFGLLGIAIVYVRTRYAVGIYLVVFGSIIVAAYKMGMVHERPRIVTHTPLGADLVASPPTSINGSTLELNEEKPSPIIMATAAKD